MERRIEHAPLHKFFRNETRMLNTVGVSWYWLLRYSVLATAIAFASSEVVKF